MRLTPEQIQTVLNTVSEHTGRSAQTYLFGSRLDDHARGGDLDLLIETPMPVSLLEKAQLKLALESRLGLPVDLLVQCHGAVESHFLHMARARAVPLSMPQ